MKKIGKRMLAMMLAVVLVLGVMPMTAFADAPVDSGKFFDSFRWSLDSDGVLTISGEGAIGDFEEDVPPWFKYYEDITSIVVSEGVTRIGSYTFALLLNVTKVSLPASLKEIGDFAFDYCINLKSISIPEGVTTIGMAAFEYCQSLTEVSLPATVTKIGMMPFVGCYSLNTIKVSPSNEHYMWAGNALVSKDGSNLVCAAAGLTGGYTVSDSIKTIEPMAFANCLELEEIVLPTKLEHIGDLAFYGALSLKKLEISIFNMYYHCDENGILYNEEQNVVMCVPAGTEGKVKLPETVEVVYPYAFVYCQQVTEVALPEKVNLIGAFAFAASGIEKISISDNVTYIGDGAFTDCEKLTEIVFEGSAPEIGVVNPVFAGVKATVYYPGHDASWTSEVRESFGGEVTWTAYPVERPQGDVDGSGDITNSDVVIVARYLVGLISGEDIEKYGDLDGDGAVTNTDLISLARIIVEL